MDWWQILQVIGTLFSSGAFVGAIAFFVKWGGVLRDLTNLSDDLKGIKSNCREHDSRLREAEKKVAEHEGRLAGIA